MNWSQPHLLHPILLLRWRQQQLVDTELNYCDCPVISCHNVCSIRLMLSAAPPLLFHLFHYKTHLVTSPHCARGALERRIICKSQSNPPCNNRLHPLLLPLIAVGFLCYWPSVALQSVTARTPPHIQHTCPPSLLVLDLVFGSCSINLSISHLLLFSAGGIMAGVGLGTWIHLNQT